MQFIFYSPDFGVEWDYTAVDGRVGGSETYHVEMALRLARRGHHVISYTPSPRLSGVGQDYGGVRWRCTDNVDFNQPGIWVIQREPTLVDKFTQVRVDQRCWLVYHDVSYATATPARISRFSRIIALSASHQRFLNRFYGHLTNVTLCGSGIALDRIEALAAKERNPHRLIYASSPERGLEYVLASFRWAREVIPDLELHCFYGWTQECRQTPAYRQYKHKLEAMLQQDGVIWHGRVSQADLWVAFLTSGIWCYQTMFPEVFCVCACEAQALGAIPIYNPVFALADTVFAGIALRGNCWTDRVLQMRYAYEIARLAASPEAQQRIRNAMMPAARARFDLERAVDRFEALATEDYR